MSMQTYLLYVYEKEAGLDYWVHAITERGPRIMRDDLIGICKFAGMGSGPMVRAIQALSGLEIDKAALARAVTRTYLRGYRMERTQGFGPDDYDMPAEVHNEVKQVELAHFNTPEFFAELKERVLDRFDEMLGMEGL